MCAEDHGSIRWQVKQLINTDPLLPTQNAAKMSDGFFLPDSEINELIPSGKHFECQKHLVSSDCPKQWSAAEAAEGTRIMWAIVKAEFPNKQQQAIAELEEKCPNFYEKYFLPTVAPKLEKVSFHKMKEVFTAGASASSFVESMNSSMGRWFVHSFIHQTLLLKS